MPNDDNENIAAALQVAPRGPLFVNIGENLIVDGSAGLNISASTITGGVPDASDSLPEGTIIVSP